ncbi:MAG: autotransporter outer membrane beta-barrel domain-containing protein [Bradyrhizobium sp.]|uniref:autotransporter outer membrane beta-barrel domain-containing protein n=1 Tax=Bradyrhizobium sp. TaxID=376 RepID=UPI001C2A2017|nr:autotransporter outer membrane beta-barrel domain-containing protein [Bradyrhizobium sp.]MBU6463275.1 autotransporter outer membrane beta-barrel domain-containing protein [Pseudomonadota bacterium]MDE2066634.1 autotransporter outer membrane beta-barrel domain-containing protein [Bradyrhizobium sp.]MDE2472688.1 autotransporter outer membrane beta-barrel domain-containing protein [Bradyrhizobium sp.]
MSSIARVLPVACAILMCAAQASAADLPVKAGVQAAALPEWVNPILAVNNQLAIDVIGQHIDYLERDVDGTPLDSERGWQPGVQFSGSGMGNLGAITNVYVLGQFTFAKGNTSYVGSFQGGTYGDIKQSDGAETKDFDFRLGKGFDVAPNWMLTPYVGVGYHVWDRDISGAGGYHEQYEHGYAGGGLLIQYAATNRWVISANGLVGSTFNPQMATSLNGGAVFTPTTYDLGTSLIWKAGLSSDYAITPQWHVNAGFDYTNFRYGISAQAADGTLEPDSRTGIWTVKAGLGYSFYAPSAVVAKY